MTKLFSALLVISTLASTSFAQSSERVDVQDRGETLVYTYTKTEARSAEEICTTVIVQVKDKKTDKVLSSDSSETCQTMGY